MENFFKNSTKIIGTITFARPIMAGLSAVVRTLSMIIQINIHGVELVGEETLNYIREHRGTLFGTVVVITAFVVLFLTLGAFLHNRIFMSLAGFTMVLPLIILATFSEAAVKLVTLYLQTAEGALKGFHAALLEILKKMGVNASELPKPELIQGKKIAKKTHSIWMAIIPISLVSIFCIFFPDWLSVDIIPIVLFILISQSIMTDQWADIDLEADDKKLIRTARTKRRVFNLISFGLTLLVFWTAYTVTFQPSAKKTVKDTKTYVNKGSIFELPKNLIIDCYEAIAGPIKKWQAEQDSIEVTQKAARAKADLAARTDSVTTLNEVWVPKPQGADYQVIVPPGACVNFKSIVAGEPENMSFNNKNGKKDLKMNWYPTKTHYVVNVLEPADTKIIIIKIKEKK